MVSAENVLSLRYGEVFWTMMDPIPLDAELVNRFKDKTMAVVGYETDQAIMFTFCSAYFHVMITYHNLSHRYLRRVRETSQFPSLGFTTTIM